MARALRDATVVITGASSGIGRAAAVQFARAGASVVCAARREAALNDVANECNQTRGRGIAVPTDVTSDESVSALAERALSEFGGIDVWVNNAAVSLFAPFEHAPAEVYDRVIDTNLGGYVRGARAALPVFREQGRGVLINNASVFAKAGAPYISAYVLTKYAVAGFGESLRMELVDEPDIHVCTLLPASIDTPIFRQAANYTGREIRPLAPVYDADRAAAALVSLATRPRRERVVGGAGRLLRKQRLATPGAYERAAAKLVARDHFTERPAAASPGNVLAPRDDWAQVSGGWQSSPAPIRRAAVPAGALVAAGAAVAWLRRRR